MEKRNYGKSVRVRLLNIAKEKNLRYMYVLQRYFLERVLYRISISRYNDNFLLKGGSLLYAFQGMECRPTVDVDLLGECISSDSENLRNVFAEILAIPCEEDGVTFEYEKISIEPIAIEKKYPGTRLIFIAHLDTIVHSLMLDIGFGDVVIPYPSEIDYPVLLDTLPEINLKAYSLETVLAEKFNAMVDRDEQNSRMKDFYDCYWILSTMVVDAVVLGDAIKATFANRKTPYNSNLVLFTEQFYKDVPRQLRWNAFLRKINYKGELPFEEVMRVLKDKFETYWEGLKPLCQPKINIG